MDLGDQKNPCLDLLFWAVSKSLAPRMEHKRFQPRPTEDQRRIRIDFKVELLYRLYIPSRAIFVAIVSWRRLSALSTSSLPNSLPLSPRRRFERANWPTIWSPTPPWDSWHWRHAPVHWLLAWQSPLARGDRMGSMAAPGMRYDIYIYIILDMNKYWDIIPMDEKSFTQSFCPKFTRANFEQCPNLPAALVLWSNGVPGVPGSPSNLGSYPPRPGLKCLGPCGVITSLWLATTWSTRPRRPRHEKHRHWRNCAEVLRGRFLRNCTCRSGFVWK